MDGVTEESKPRDRDLAPVAALIGEPARTAMHVALADGRILPAGELARRAGVRPATASAHLRRLVEGGLVRVTMQGHHRYHELAGPNVAAALEVLAQVAPAAPIRSLRDDRSATALAQARTCYDHLAGQRGIELRDRLLAVGALEAIDDRDHALTAKGEGLISELAINEVDLRAARRVLARNCIDWTHRRPHLAGALPAAITARFFALGWLSHRADRGVRVTPDYDQHLDQWLGPGSAGP